MGIIHHGNLLFRGTKEELKVKGRSEIIIKANPLIPAAEFLKTEATMLPLEKVSFIWAGQNIDLAKLNRELVLNGFGVSLSESSGNLEDIFLDLTGR